MSALSAKNYATGSDFDAAVADLQSITGYYDEPNHELVQPTVEEICAALAKMCAINNIK